MSKKKKKKEMECRELTDRDLTESETLAKELKFHKKNIARSMKQLDSLVKNLYNKIYNINLLADDIIAAKDTLDKSFGEVLFVIDPKNKKDRGIDF